MTPKRIQRKCTKGWRMPEGAAYVGGPSKWENPFTDPSAGDVVEMYRAMIDRFASSHRECWHSDYPGVWDRHIIQHIRDELGGRDLVCWCPLDQPCHADVLLEVANR